MALRQSSKKTEVEIGHDSEDDQPSQSTVEMMQTAQEIVVAGKQERQSQRKAIEAEYERKTRDIAFRINKLFQSRKNRVTKSQRAQWDRLDSLNKKRLALESAIIASMKALEQHSANTSNELAAMFEGRIEDIQENLASQPAKDLVSFKTKQEV